jgi:tRNA pseudouridine55 synthase
MKVEGIFTINKPLGISSQRAVQIVKYWARRKTGNNKIKVGHAGTLDPLASGVLVMAVGRKYTSQIDKIVSSEKEYIADVTLGQNSSTDDAEGEKTVVNKDKKPTVQEIKNVLKEFVGNIEQTPPTYSAIKIDGQEAYKRVRRGEKVEMKKRKVHIKNIEIISYEYPNLKISVTCGKGTYIRSLARDVGENLKTGAYLSGLIRTRVGEYKLEDAKNIKDFTMRIVVHACELDEERIDGTRIYISEVFKYFGGMASDDDFYIYHKNIFNKSLAPQKRNNYHIKLLNNFPAWTQTKFAVSVLRQKPDVVWVPLHNLPRLRSKKIKYVVTIHDLAFKIFPETFPESDVKKLNLQTDYAVKNADHIIAVSKSTRNDLLKFYPELKREKITVIHHGIDKEVWQKEYSLDLVQKILGKYKLTKNKYLIHVGAIQPRKNLTVLIDAFEKVKKVQKDMKLLLVGGDGWKWENIHEHAKKSKYVKDVIFTGNISKECVVVLMQNASAFVFPSLYEGFGISGLEALATGTPVVAARNSSIPEVLGNVAEYFDAKNSDECAESVLRVLSDTELQGKLKEEGFRRVEKFTWDKTARKTLQVLRK